MKLFMMVLFLIDTVLVGMHGLAEAAALADDTGDYGYDPVPHGEDYDTIHRGVDGELTDLIRSDEAPTEVEANEEPEDDARPLTSVQILGIFEKMDAHGNSDGKVSFAEVNDFAQNMRREMAKMELNDIFKPKDTNNDGKLTWSEYLGKPGDNPEERQQQKALEFQELDTNGDRFIDADELANLFHHHTNPKVEMALTTFAMKDKDVDRNGVLSLEEFYHHLRDGDEPIVVPDEDKQVFNKLDTDSSGSLSLKELSAWESGSFQAEEAVKKLFQRADKDADNVLTAAEMDAARREIAQDSDAQNYLMLWAAHHHQHKEL